MTPSDFTYIFFIWLSTLIIGWISWPSAAFFLGKLSDRGYSFSKIFGWIAVSYLVFLLATLRIVPLTLWGIVLVVFTWACINIVIEKRFRGIQGDSRGGRLINFRQIVFTELLFILLMGFWAFTRSFKPEIYGIERFMDFGFIQALFNANTLPLFDIWFSGESLNYYYFGHFVGYIVLSLSKIPVIPGFFVLVAWMFGLLGALAYRLGADFFILLKEKTSPIAGAISLFTILFAGTWYMAPWLLNYAKHFLFESPAPSFWFADPTRIIPGTITEIPIYGFLVADLHPHMWGLINGALVLAALFCAWRSDATVDLKNKYLWLFGLLLGVTFMLNSWDAVTLGFLTIAVFGYIHFKKRKIHLLVYVVLLAGLAYAVALPWSMFFEAPISGIGLVRDKSPILEWFSFWGFLVSIAVISLILRFVTPHLGPNDNPSLPPPTFPRFHLIVIGVAILFLIFMELFYVQDILRDGEWFRANTVFKITAQLWLWLGVLDGSMIVWSVISLKKVRSKIALLALYFFVFLGPAAYPVKAIWQFQIDERRPVPLNSGLQWWREKYPSDYEEYEYLQKVRDSLPQNDKVRRIVEAEGESYTDSARFSTFLGWPAIIGWPVHEWTWRGSYDKVGSRRSEVRDIYTSADSSLTQRILEKYKIDYVIVGELEAQLYGAELKREKLKSLGRVVFENKKAMVVEVTK